MNGDGVLDVLVACELDHLTYFQNPGRDVREGRWPRLIPSVTAGRGSWIRVYLADLDQDGRLEAIAPNKGAQQPEGEPVPDTFPLEEISLFEIEGDPLVDSSWTETVLATVTVPMNSRPRDRDGEDKTAASIAGRLGWFENLGDPAAEWTRHDVSRRVRGMFDEFVVFDMDRDGDDDLVATRGNSGHYDGVFWLEQVRTAEPQRAFFPARGSESRHLPLPPGD